MTGVAGVAGVAGAVPAVGPGSAPALTTARQVTPDGGWPRSWRGEWVAALEPAAADRHDVVAPTRGPGRWSFRARVHLDAVPERAPLRLTADSRYALHVNGTEVGRGPVRSQPRRLTYDTHDVAPHLRVGANTVVVLVTHYARANSSWQPAAANAGLGADAVLVLEADLGAGAGGETGDGRWLVTGPHWEVRREAAWSQTTSAAGIHGGIPVELLDARELHPGWRSGEGDGWSPAVVRHAVHLGALARSRPPTDPYGALLPRPVPPLAGDVVVPATARVHAPLAADAGSTTRAGAPVADDAPVERVLAAWPGVDAGTPVDDPAVVVLDAPAGRPVPVSLDVGRITAGRVRLTLDAPAGTVVELLYREAAPSTSDAAIDSVPRVGARYTARGHGDELLAQEVNGFRHVHALVTAPAGSGAPARVVLRDLAVVEQLFPAGRTGRWASSDPELDALHAAGVRTVALNALDSYTDCPTREQRAWVGDGVVHASVHLATAQDWTMALRYVDLAASPRPDGILPMSVVGDLEADGGHTIPDWSLYWVRGVRDLWEHTGDADALARHLPVVRRVLEWFTPYQGDDGVLADVPEWTLVDWSSVLLTGRSAILTALWARGLRDLEVLADALGQRADAVWARQRWAAAQAGFEQFWDEGRGTYVDHLPSGTGDDGDGGGLRRLPASQLAGALAIVSGLSPAERVERVVAWTSDTSRQVVRSWVGGDGGYDLAKIDEQMRGVQRVDWDAEREVVVAEPFAAHLVHDAYAAAGRPDLVVASCRRWSVFLADGYDTFGECWGWGTPVHGWSATPTRDLVRSVLGVAPAEPGFAAVRVAPAFGVVERVEGEVPTPHGWVRVVVDGRDVAVNSPVPVVLVDADGIEHRLPAGAARR